MSWTARFMSWPVNGAHFFRFSPKRKFIVTPIPSPLFWFYNFFLRYSVVFFFFYSNFIFYEKWKLSFYSLLWQSIFSNGICFYLLCETKKFSLQPSTRKSAFNKNCENKIIPHKMKTWNNEKSLPNSTLFILKKERKKVPHKCTHTLLQSTFHRKWKWFSRIMILHASPYIFFWDFNFFRFSYSLQKNFKTKFIPERYIENHYSAVLYNRFHWGKYFTTINKEKKWKP